MTPPVRLMRGIIAVALLMLIAGCCNSFERRSTAGEVAAPSSPDVAGLIAVADSAVTKLDLRGRVERAFDPNKVFYAVAVTSGAQGLWVMIDAQTLTIYLRWRMYADQELASRVQNAIEREFTPGTTRACNSRMSRAAGSSAPDSGAMLDIVGV